MTPSLLTDSVTYDLERAVHYALLWGLEGLELRSVGGPNDRVPYVNEQKVRLRLLESELPVVAVDPGMFVGHAGDRVAWLNELVELGETLSFCRRIGCSRVVVSSFLRESPDGMRQAAEVLGRAAERLEGKGVRICVLNEQGYVASTGKELAELLDRVGSDRVSAAWSPAEALMSGEEPGEGLDALAGRVGLVRCRNVGRVGTGWEPRPIDGGAVDWLSQLRRLDAAGFDGPLCLVVDVEPAAKQGLWGATEIIRLVRSLPREAKHETL